MKPSEVFANNTLVPGNFMNPGEAEWQISMLLKILDELEERISRLEEVKYE